MLDPNGYLYSNLKGHISWSVKGLEVLHGLECEIKLRKMVGRLLSDRGFTIERLWWEYSLKGRVFVNLGQEGIQMSYYNGESGWVRQPLMFWGDEELHYMWGHIRDLWFKSLHDKSPEENVT